MAKRNIGMFYYGTICISFGSVVFGAAVGRSTRARISFLPLDFSLFYLESFCSSSVSSVMTRPPQTMRKRSSLAFELYKTKSIS
jgi:hypothetical protein